MGRSALAKLLAVLAIAALPAMPAAARGWHGRHGYGDPDAGWAAPAPAPYADARRDRRPAPRPGWHGAEYGQRAYQAPPPPRRGRCDHGSGGTILGAIAGGLLGNGAAGPGALAGRAIDRGC